MPCTKANPGLTYSLSKPGWLALLSGCCCDRHLAALGGRSGDEAEPKLRGSPKPPQPRGQLQPGDMGRTEGNLPHGAAREENGYQRGWM